MKRDFRRMIAEYMGSFNTLALFSRPPVGPGVDEELISFYHAVKDLVHLHPGLGQRYYYAGGRTFSAIHYLLSPRRQNPELKSVQSLIDKAIYGTERLHDYLGFVSANDVRIIADYLDAITAEQLSKHYNPIQMVEAGVYKMHATDDEERFQIIWEEFTGMRDVYRAAAEHHEAMIVVID